MLRLRPHRSDVLLAAGVVAFTQLEVWLEGLHPLWVSAPLTLVQALSLLWRRSAPLGAVVVTVAAAVVGVVAVGADDAALVVPPPEPHAAATNDPIAINVANRHRILMLPSTSIASL